MPPFQNADEPAHFDRAWQVAHGQLQATAGGTIDSGTDLVYGYVTKLPFNSKARFTPADRAGAEAVKWTGQLAYRPFQNTGNYPPTGYLPQAVGIAIGKTCGMGVMRTLVLARVLNGGFAILVCVFALNWCRGGKLVMFAVLLLPMTLSLFASLSQDATLIALTALAFAVISRQIATGVPLSLAQTAVLAISLLIVSLGRPPYGVLSLVFLTPGLFPRWRIKPSWLPGVFLAGLLEAVTFVWWTKAYASTRSLVYAGTANVGGGTRSCSF